MLNDIIKQILRPFGLSRRYLGFSLLIVAVTISIQDDGSRFPLTRNLYARVAEECDCTVHCVERNIRTVIKRAWAVNPGYMRELAGYLMAAPPSSTEFIEIISSYILREHLTERV